MSATISEVMIPIVSVVGFFTWLLARSPVGRAYADRLRSGARPADHAALLEAVDTLRRDVAELAERMDFAERLLAKERDPLRVAPGNPGVPGRGGPPGPGS